LKVKELRGELRSVHAENARLRQQVEMATVLERIAPASEIPALLADSAALMREMICEIDSQRLQIESLQNKLAQATAEVEGFRSARVAYASEFPLKDGEPDVHNVHQHIRNLKAEVERLEADLARLKEWNRQSDFARAEMERDR